mgnify:CR=1 FL=1
MIEGVEEREGLMGDGSNGENGFGFGFGVKF